MLSRVADALYWMGRYLERAEHCTRLLLVTEDFSTEILALHEELARAEWADLLAIFPGSRLTRRAFPKAAPFAFPYLTSFYLDDQNPYSTFFSLRKARENARAVREALTLEVFLGLNDAYHALEAQARRGIRDVPAFRDALSATQKGLLGTVGAIAHTLTRDQGWLFLKLGEAIERTARTATILIAKLPALLDPAPKTDIPLYYTRWRSLLRGLASLENYRKARGAQMEPALVLRFVLFDADAPRALNYGCRAVKDCLDRLDKPGELTAPARIVGRLCSRLSYEDREVMRRGDYLGFLHSVLAGLDQAHEAIAAQYFVT
ncbi:MAG: alpha-E domain-containing protein [Candidatus Rokubacteria bacterium]|nr:alpha-E domain-containing protein [Candidatus Rokubacteria bacterium]